MAKYLLVDGYNIINAWPRLKKIVTNNLEEAREKLIEDIVEYKHYTGETVTIVFDAHLVKKSRMKKMNIKGVYIVFTKEHETADSYIEKKVEELTRNRKNQVRVATSDWAEQQVVLGSGATRISARELHIEMEQVKKKIRMKTEETKKIRSTLEDRIDSEIVEKLEKWRRSQGLS